MYQASDIEVFIFAHNRASFLREALDCYFRQTVAGFRLVILANAPTPEVVQVAHEYAAKGAELVLEPSVLNVHGCVRRCQELASRSITVLAHDDDWVHPAYLETLLKCYNQNPEIRMALSAMGVGSMESFSVVVSALGNGGLGLGLYGPAYSWASLPEAGKWLLSFLMMVGRLELFTVFLLFLPEFWKER